jgi:hypothetical protein
MAQIRFHHLLREKIMIEIGDETERLAGGYADYAVYREQVGYLKALKRVLELADDLEKGMT